jgi:hypothetical protein
MALECRRRRGRLRLGARLGDEPVVEGDELLLGDLAVGVEVGVLELGLQVSKYSGSKLSNIAALLAGGKNVSSGTTSKMVRVTTAYPPRNHRVTTA